MEIIYFILGSVMFYSGIHSVIIIFKKIKDTTSYEQVVLWFSLVLWVLFIIGSLN